MDIQVKTNEALQPSETEASDLSFIPIATSQLKAMVERHRQTLSPEAFRELIEDIRVSFTRYSDYLGGLPPGPTRALATHKLINVPIAQNKTILPTCSMGCGACCHLEVEITQDEGELLALAVEEGYVIDRTKLALQASQPRAGAAWARRVHEENRCVFLGEDQNCRVYEYRPSICRKHVVVSPPEDCMRPGGNPMPILIPLAEVVLSAALSQPNNPKDSLSRSLLNALNGLGASEPVQ